MKSVTTFLHFEGNCRQAMQFYQKCLGTELQLTPYPNDKGQPSTAPDAHLMHSQLIHNGQPILMASDSAPGGTAEAGNNFTVSVDCESLPELERLFTAFSKDAEIRLPLGDMPWGARFGMLTDKFGIQWFFNYALPQ
jgi:PhnB protein